MDIVKRVQQLMNDRGWTDYRLSKESGLSGSVISNMMKRNNSPTIPTLEALCSAFGITITEFFANGEEPFPLTAEQHQLLARWSAMTDDQKKAMLDLMNAIIKSQR